MSRVCYLIAILTGFAAAAPIPRTLSPYQHYSLKLNALYSPQSQAQGLYFKVKIDGGPTLRMLLDSGAKDIVLDRRSAAALGRRSGVDMDLVGFGSSTRAAKLVAPGTVTIGDLVLGECEMVAVNSELMDGIDGVIPTSLFGGFLMRLNVPGKVLELDPYPAGPPVEDSFTAAVKDRDMLFFEAVVNEAPRGWVMLDTGASFNAVSSKVAKLSKAWQGFLYPAVALLGGTGETQGTALPLGGRFQVGSQVLRADPAVVVDLSDLASHHGFEIAGVIGYPALKTTILTIDYRDSLVKFARK